MNGQFFGFGAYSSGGFNYQYFSMPLDGSSVNVFLTGSFGEPYPAMPLIPSPDGYIYHVVAPAPLMATFIKIDLLGNITNVHVFDPVNEGEPLDGAPILRAPDGSFYGIATTSHIATTGWFFKIDSTGNFTKLATFPTTWIGGVPLPLVMSPGGTIYGAFATGRVNGGGAIFKYVPGGAITTLYSFTKFGVSIPNALVLADDGNLYGGTRTSPSYLFAFNLKTNSFRTLTQMSGAGCQCELVQGSDGKIYGAASFSPSGYGAIFSLDMGLAPPKPKVSLFSPTSGIAAQKILLWGHNFLGATAVDFNGVPALGFTVTSSYSIYATVPLGATTGPITITTPAGTFQTTSNFAIQ